MARPVLDPGTRLRPAGRGVRHAPAEQKGGVIKHASLSLGIRRPVKHPLAISVLVRGREVRQPTIHERVVR